MNNYSRREAIIAAATAGAIIPLSNIISAEAQTPQQSESSLKVFSGKHLPKPLTFDTTKLIGLSERLIKSHHENNYTGAVKALNAVELRLAAMLNEKDLPPYMYGDLKREEAIRTGSVVMHELYFASLGGDGKAVNNILFGLNLGWGSLETWEQEFKKIGMSLAGGSGWVTLGYNFHTSELHNYWSWDHSVNSPFTAPLLVMDMYEHAYALDYGAAAAKYIDAFMSNVNWSIVNQRFMKAQKVASELRS